MRKKEYLSIDLKEENGKIYKRLVEAPINSNINDIIIGVKRDIYIEPTEEELILMDTSTVKVENLGFEVSEEIKNDKNRILLVLDSEKFLKRPLVGMSY